MHDEDAEPVCRLPDLEPTDALLVGALRNWAVGMGQRRIMAWVAVWQGFADWLGPRAAPAAVESFEQLMNTLSDHARRTIHFHAPGCPCVDADEFGFVTMLAEFHGGSEQQARTLANGFVDAAGVDDLLDRGRTLMATVQASPPPHDHDSPVGDARRSDRPRPPGSDRLH